MSDKTLYFSNTGNEVIKIEVTNGSGFPEIVNASSMETTWMWVGKTYNFKLTKGREVRHFKYVATRYRSKVFLTV
jgi:hypothetical protein